MSNKLTRELPERWKNKTVFDVLPDGWKILKGATTAPIGYALASNGKSVFDKAYETALIRLQGSDNERG